MLKEESKGLVPCGIPYIFGVLGDVSKNIMGPKPFIDAGGEVLVDPATKVDVKIKLLPPYPVPPMASINWSLQPAPYPRYPPFYQGMIWMA